MHPTIQPVSFLFLPWYWGLDLYPGCGHCSEVTEELSKGLTDVNSYNVWTEAPLISTVTDSQGLIRHDTWWPLYSVILFLFMNIILCRCSLQEPQKLQKLRCYCCPETWLFHVGIDMSVSMPVDSSTCITISWLILLSGLSLPSLLSTQNTLSAKPSLLVISRLLTWCMCILFPVCFRPKPPSSGLLSCCAVLRINQSVSSVLSPVQCVRISTTGRLPSQIFLTDPPIFQTSSLLYIIFLYDY